MLRQVPYGMLSLGGITVDVGAAGPRDGSYTARQDICTGTISSEVAATGPARFGMSTIVAADENVISTNISCTGCLRATPVTVELWATKGATDQPFDQATCGPDNMPRYGTFRLNFHRFDRFKLDLRGYTQP